MPGSKVEDEGERPHHQTGKYEDGPTKDGVIALLLRALAQHFRLNVFRSIEIIVERFDPRLVLGRALSCAPITQG